MAAGLWRPKTRTGGELLPAQLRKHINKYISVNHLRTDEFTNRAHISSKELQLLMTFDKPPNTSIAARESSAFYKVAQFLEREELVVKLITAEATKSQKASKKPNLEEQQRRTEKRKISSSRKGLEFEPTG